MRHKTVILAEVDRDLSPELQSWVESYKARRATLHHKARCAEDLEFLRRYSEEKGVGLAEKHILCEAFLGEMPSHDYNYRFTIWSRGETSNTARLWAFLDQGIKVSAVYQLVREASRHTRLTRTSGSTFDEMLARCIGEFEGKVVGHDPAKAWRAGHWAEPRKKVMEEMVTSEHAQKKRAADRAEVKKTATPQKRAERTPEQVEVRKFVEAAQRAFQALLDRQVVGVEAPSNTLIERRFKTEFRMLVSLLQTTVDRAQGPVLADHSGELRAAAEVIGVTLLDGKVDMKLAKARYKQLAREAHPDRGGDVVKIQIINNAWATLRDLTEN